MKNVAIILGVLLVLLLLLVGVNWFMPLDYEDDYAQKVSSSLAEELKRAEIEAVRLRNSQPTDEFWINSSYSFFLLKDGKINAWSKNDFVPDLSSMVDDFALRFIQNSNGSFVIRKWSITDDAFLLLVLPLKFQYGIINDYLEPSKSSILPSRCDITTNKSMQGVCVSAGNDDCFFKIVVNRSELFQNSKKAKLEIFIIVLIVITLIWLVNLIIINYTQKRRYETLFAVNLFLFMSLRLGMIRLNIPNVFFSSDLFDPTFYASSSLNVSIGDLLLNSIGVTALCAVLFFFFPRFSLVKRIPRLNKPYLFTISTLSVFVIYLAVLFPYLYIESIYHNSAISLEITDSLSLSLLRVTAFLSIILGCISSYFVIQVFFRLAISNKKNSNTFLASTFISGTILFVFFFLTDGKEYWIVLITGCALLPALYFSRLISKFNKITFNSYIQLLILIIGFSFEFSLSALKFNEEKKTESQFKFGNNYLVDQDFLAEFLLHESATSISKDLEIKKVIGTKNEANIIQERITQYYLTSYFDRYQVSVSCVSQDSTSSRIDWIKSMLTEANKTTVENIFFVNDPSSDTLKRYITMIPIQSWNGLKNSFIVLDLSLKKIIPETVFPELIIDNRYRQNFKGKEFSYALLTDESIASSFGSFNYEKQFDMKWLGQINLYTEGLIVNGYRHVALEYQPHRIAIITASVYPLEYVVVNFSFFVAIGLSIILFLLILSFFRSWLNGVRLGYATRIQLYVYLAFFIPLLIVSLVTLRLIINSAENQKEEEYLSKAKVLEERISTIIDNYKVQGYEYQSQLEAKLIEIAEVANLDASVFTKDGNVVASSEPLIFKNHLLSGIINRTAWHSIIVNHENFSIQSESIGKLFYKNVYWRIRSPGSGEVIAILSIPFFESASSLERTQINVVSAILGVFSIAFILFSLLSYFAISGLTAPLRFVTQALRRTSLSGENKPINWKGDDELGVMAYEYNRMLVNLEDSKAELQKNQKEIAWREVAQQVAHEIKNPLTPMKLSLQQLELEMLRGSQNKEKSQKSIQVILRQIDILNDIAGSFSNFAKMPAPEITSLNVTELLRKTVGLYSNHNDAHIDCEFPEDIFVKGDESIILRAFSNVILNSIQSKRQLGTINLNITASYDLKDCIISFRDNGIGISDENKNNVFRPYFTTKSAGAGLGLAIVKQTLELCNSSIWFETEIGRGTVFYIQLPLDGADKLI